MDILVDGSEENLKMYEGNYKLSWLYCKIKLCDSLWELLGFLFTWNIMKTILQCIAFSSASQTWMTEKGRKIRIKAKFWFVLKNQDK